RGTSDMKGFLAVCLAKLPEIDVKKLKRPLQFAMSFDEETGCTGVLHMIAGIKDKVAPGTIVIVGEPTGMKVVSGHKGGTHFRTEVRGFETHSSLTHQGVSAIHYGARLMTKLDDIARELANNPDKESGYEPAYSTISIGLANGGTAGNIIARQFVFQWEIRWMDANDVTVVEKRFAEYCNELQEEMQTKNAETWIKTEHIGTVPMFQKDLDGAAEHFIRGLNGSNDVHVVSYQTEAGHFQNADMSVVICGPGHIDQAHKPEEFIAVQQLEVCEDLISRIIGECSR
ncbi:MAG: M20/M25/M40 family metallo-hydrolase, partial [Pseudomonadota bacterium]